MRQTQHRVLTLCAAARSGRDRELSAYTVERCYYPPLATLLVFVHGPLDERVCNEPALVNLALLDQAR